ncbi:hypothetical protein Tco_0668074 [Tanacetum coccineum]
MKRSQDMQLIQKLRDDQKRMKKVFEVMSGRNIVTNSRVTPSWREIVSLAFSEAGVLHVNWTSFGHCVPRRDSDKLRHDQKCKNMKRSQDMQPNFMKTIVMTLKRMKKVFEVIGIILLILGGFAWCYTHAYIEDGVTFIAKSSVTFLAKSNEDDPNEMVFGDAFNVDHNGTGLGAFSSLSKAFGIPNHTSMAAKINDIERQMFDGKLILMGDDGNH